MCWTLQINPNKRLYGFWKSEVTKLRYLSFKCNNRVNWSEFLIFFFPFSFLSSILFSICEWLSMWRSNDIFFIVHRDAWLFQYFIILELMFVWKCFLSNVQPSVVCCFFSISIKLFDIYIKPLQLLAKIKIENSIALYFLHGKTMGL